METTEHLRRSSSDGTPTDEDQTPEGRLRKIEGVDYKRGAIEYTRKIGPAHTHYHRTKPFYNAAAESSEPLLEGLGASAHRYFCDFANIAALLPRPRAGQRILEVGCGPGWLCEYFARLGYDVIGTDISPDLIRVARERVARIPYPVDHETPIRCRFEVHDIDRAPLTAPTGEVEIFDVVICYDALHHFEDERAVMRHLAAMLDDDGILFVLEGERPPSGSEGERRLIEVMRDYGTLESPFTRNYLLELLSAHDFHVVGDYVSVNGLFEREVIVDGRLPIASTPLNYLMCKKLAPRADGAKVADSRAPGLLRAGINLGGAWRGEFAPGERLRVPLEIANTGDTLWLASSGVRAGVVTLGVKVFDEGGGLIDERHNEPPLPCAIAPSETMSVTLNFPAPLAPGRYTLKIDLIDQHICWFEERGSLPLALPFTVLAQ